MNTPAKISIISTLLLTFLLATSMSASAYSYYNNYYRPSYYSYNSYQPNIYASGSYTGSIIGPLWNRYSIVSPYLYDRTLTHFEQYPLSSYQQFNIRDYTIGPFY